jgi:hypothetical protein
MKKELFIHFSFLISFFIFISLSKGWFSLSFWPFWLGGILGTFLPDIDHLIYVYILRPGELTSQRVSYMFKKRRIWETFRLLAETRQERHNLIFHSFLFQIIFLVFTFFIITSTGSLFGRGLVLAFSFHLLVDQAVDLMEVGNIDNWFSQMPFLFNKEKVNLYWIGIFILVLIFGFLL